jgi:two-component system, LytTR family, response regulator
MLKVVIVEDELHSRESLKNLLIEFCGGVLVCGAAANVSEGVDVIRREKPDLVFLDVELQTGTGFDLLRQLGEIDFDLVFTTAFEQYAIQAIKCSSLDYLLKPIDLDELLQAVEKANKNYKNRHIQSQLDVLLSNLDKPRLSSSKKIALSTAEELEFVDIDDIVLCEANGAYTTIYLTSNRQIVVSKHLKEYETMLEDYQFFRTHNSFLVNLKQVQRFIKTEGGYLLMKNQSRVSVSPKKRDELFGRMMNL